MKKTESILASACLLAVIGCGGAEPEPATPSGDVSFAPNGAPSSTGASATSAPYGTPSPSRGSAPTPSGGGRKWGLYTSTEGGFQISLPCVAPVEDVAKGGNESFHFTSHIIHCPDRKLTEAMYFAEYWTDVILPAAWKNAAPPGGLDAAFATRWIKLMADGWRTRGLTVTQHAANVPGYSAYDLVATKQRRELGNGAVPDTLVDARVVARVLVNLPRQYVQQIINAEMGLEAENQAFLDSFKVTRR